MTHPWAKDAWQKMECSGGKGRGFGSHHWVKEDWADLKPMGKVWGKEWVSGDGMDVIRPLWRLLNTGLKNDLKDMGKEWGKRRGFGSHHWAKEGRADLKPMGIGWSAGGWNGCQPALVPASEKCLEGP